MFRAFMIGAVSAVALMLSTGSFAQQSQPGTAQDAQGMLTKTVAALKADKTNTIAMINKGEGVSYKAISIRLVFRPLTARSLPLLLSCRNLLGQISGH